MELVKALLLADVHEKEMAKKIMEEEEDIQVALSESQIMEEETRREEEELIDMQILSAELQTLTQEETVQDLWMTLQEMRMATEENQTVEECQVAQILEQNDLELAMALSEMEFFRLDVQTPEAESLVDRQPQRSNVARLRRVFEGDNHERNNVDQLREAQQQWRESHEQLVVHHIEQLPDLYKDYRVVPTMFSEYHMWPLPAILQQQHELQEVDRQEDEILEWEEGSDKDKCPICYTNVATRVALPCSHKLCCRACYPDLVNTSMFYSYIMATGEILPSDRRLPIQCFICRAIIGQVVTI